MGIDWETILGAEGSAMADAYDDLVWEADRYYEDHSCDFEDDFYEDDEDPDIIGDLYADTSARSFRYVEDLRHRRFLRRLLAGENISFKYEKALGTIVRRFLIREGYAVFAPGLGTKVPTDRGEEELGLYMKEGVTCDGEEFTSMVFGRKAQELIAGRFYDLLDEAEAEMTKGGQQDDEPSTTLLAFC